MANSRSAIEFMQRAGMKRIQLPRPRLAIDDLLVNILPTEHTQITQSVLSDYEGRPRPDRGSTRPWPTQQVIDGHVS